MEKEQTLPFDSGMTPMTYYSATTVQPYISEMENEEYTMDRFVVGLNSVDSIISGSLFLGTQKFASSERKRPLYNDCSNQKIRGFNFPYGATFRSARRPTTCYNDAFRRFGVYPSYLSYVQDADLTLNWALASNARSRAVWSMKPRFEGRVSLLNSLFELKDFRDIGKFVVKTDFRSLAGAFKDLRGIVRRGQKHLGMTDEVTIGAIPKILRGLDSATRGAASLILTKNLAIDPTIADVIAITDQMHRIAADQERDFAKRGMLPQSSHFTELLGRDGGEVYNPLGANYYWLRAMQTVETKYTASSEYMYRYKLRKRSAAIRKYWGLNLSAETVWNALPFTWIADYFIGIGDSFHAMETDPNVTLLPLQFCESLEKKASAAYVTRKDSRLFWLIVNGKPLLHGEPANIPIAGYDATSYVRNACEPPFGPALPKIKWPSFGQLTNLAALVRCFI